MITYDNIYIIHLYTSQLIIPLKQPFVFLQFPVAIELPKARENYGAGGPPGGMGEFCFGKGSVAVAGDQSEIMGTNIYPVTRAPCGR